MQKENWCPRCWYYSILNLTLTFPMWVWVLILASPSLLHFLSWQLLTLWYTIVLGIQAVLDWPLNWSVVLSGKIFPTGSSFRDHCKGKGQLGTMGECPGIHRLVFCFCLCPLLRSYNAILFSTDNKRTGPLLPLAVSHVLNCSNFDCLAIALPHLYNT